MVMLQLCTVNGGGLCALVVVVLCVMLSSCVHIKVTQKTTGRSLKMAYEC
jgi:hypothetical protein